MLIDSHCHLNFPELQDRLPEVLANMAAADVKQALAISVSMETYQEVFKLADENENIYTTVGVHPDREDVIEMSTEFLVQEAKHPKVVGIGETGLDYHWCKGDLTWQHERFRSHIRASNEAGLPIIIHTRDAAADTLKILAEEKIEQGVIHCFTEDTDFAKACLDLGLYISFSGIVTFKNAAEIQAAAKYIPEDRYLVETDAPFLAPVPKRGKTNEPAYVKHTAEFLAQLRGVEFATLAQQSTENFYRLFSKVPRYMDTKAQ